MPVIGLISPGDMGTSVGAAAKNSGATVIWAGESRSESSHKRAADAGLEDCGTLDALVEKSGVILSVCPPHDAENVAKKISGKGFTDTFVDCNAIAPERSRRLAELFSPGQFVDGGIVGGPAWNAEDGTCLYLSGDKAADIADLFKGSPLHTNVISNKVGAASALKMTFAAYTKGTTALLSAILAVADKEGVRAVLEAQWGETFTKQTHQRLVNNSTKAWRFSGEMREIAATFENAGLPPGFHLAAAEVFEKLSGFKDVPAEDIEQFLRTLNSQI